jgi:REP element-mobilizing transposase RayT
MGFLLVGWAFMPDHFHVLVKLEHAAGKDALWAEPVN